MRMNSSTIYSTDVVACSLASPRFAAESPKSLLPMINLNQDASVDEVCDLSNKTENTNSTAKSASKKELSCVICFENPPNAVFMNCGHGGMHSCKLFVKQLIFILLRIYSKGCANSALLKFRSKRELVSSAEK